MNATQQRFLSDRLLEVRRSKLNGYDGLKFPITTAVKAARRNANAARTVINRWEERKRKARQKRDESISLAYSKCRQAIIIESDAKKALKLIEAFDRRKF